MDNWDDIRIFLAVARYGGLAHAAKSLGINHTTVSRRLTGLESAVGTLLVVRSPSGVTLTAAGMRFMEYAERIESETIAAHDHLSSGDSKVTGRVRLATREAFGTWLVCPRVNFLHERHPDLILELVPEARTLSLLKRDADIAVTMTYPTDTRLFSLKLTDYRLGLFASRAYLETHGPIRKMEDLRGKTLIWYIDEMIDVPELRYLANIIENGRAAFQSTTMIAQQIATSSGIGLGILPLFSARLDPELVQILPENVGVTRSYWLTVHPDMRKLPRIRAVIDFLLETIRENQGHF